MKHANFTLVRLFSGRVHSLLPPELRSALKCQWTSDLPLLPGVCGVGPGPAFHFEMGSTCLSVCVDGFSFEATSKKPVILVGACALEVARSLVCLDPPETPGLPLRSITLKCSNGQAVSPSPSSMPAWRRKVCYLSLESGGLADPQYSFATPIDLLDEVRKYASRFSSESKCSNAGFMDRFQTLLVKLELHASTAFAPYEEMTESEKVRSAIAIVLSLNPEGLILSGDLLDSECAVKAILAEDIPLVWAACGPGCKAVLVSAHAEVVNVDVRDGRRLQSRSTISQRPPIQLPRKWREHRAPSPSPFETVCVLGGSWAILMSPVLADVSEHLVSIRREVSQASPMNDVHLWQIFAASFAIFAVLYGQHRLDIGLGKDLAVAAVRCVLQLNILGYLLVPVFEIDSWWIVVIFLSVMLAVAAQEGVHLGLFLPCDCMSQKNCWIRSLLASHD